MSLLNKQICNAIFEEICVLANGEVVCSCGDPAGLKVYGNIREQAVDEIFDNRSYRAMRKYQLNSEPSCYCPTLKTNCGGRVYKANHLHSERGLVIRKLQLEPISHCNLDCPECPVHNFSNNSAYRSNRKDRLELQEMLDLVRQLPHLKIILYYNFGEPFLHSGSVPFLRGAKEMRPGLKIDTSTNGIPLTHAVMDTIARERLLDSILFSIDGVNQSSYARYRSGGHFGTAFSNMVYMREAVSRYGAESDIRLEWQYILFDWNDSDEEIEEAKTLSRLHDIPIKWVLTHTPGKSKRFTYENNAYQELVEDARYYQNLTCDLQCVDMVENGIKGRIYSHELLYTNLEYKQSELSVDLTVCNTSGESWEKDSEHPYCVGLRFLDEVGSVLAEHSIAVLDRSISAGESINLHVEKHLPKVQGAHYLQLDMIHGWICWFQERGAETTVIPLQG